MESDEVLCIASCGKAKIWNRNLNTAATKAEDVYVGRYAKSCIEYARNFYPSSWCILSAKYGFLVPDDIVPTDYNVTFNNKKTNPISIEQLKRQADEKNLIRFKKIVIIAGKKYAKIASEVFPDAAIINLLNGYGGIFKQASILSEAVRKNVPLNEISKLVVDDNNKNKNYDDPHKSLSRQVSFGGASIHEKTTIQGNNYKHSNSDTTSICAWLHQQLEVLPPIRFPFDLKRLPFDGIYFFYEEGESWGHGGSGSNDNKPRIVRIGTHRDGNFKSRIAEHFLLDEHRKMNFTADMAAPHDRSIFRKNIGRALLLSSAGDDDYLRVWEIDFTGAKNRKEHGGRET